jgi:hypothetical protein
VCQRRGSRSGLLRKKTTAATATSTYKVTMPTTAMPLPQKKRVVTGSAPASMNGAISRTALTDWVIDATMGALVRW